MRMLHDNTWQYMASTSKGELAPPHRLRRRRLHLWCLRLRRRRRRRRRRCNRRGAVMLTAEAFQLCASHLLLHLRSGDDQSVRMGGIGRKARAVGKGNRAQSV